MTSMEDYKNIKTTLTEDNLNGSRTQQRRPQQKMTSMEDALKGKQLGTLYLCSLQIYFHRSGIQEITALIRNTNLNKLGLQSHTRL